MRLAYLGQLIGVGLGVAALMVGALAKAPAPALLGVAALALAGACRLILRRSAKFNVDAPPLEILFSEEPASAASGGVQVERIIGLLQQWDRLEQQRGLPGFDPWALQAVRQEIRQAIAENPALERLFRP